MQLFLRKFRAFTLVEMLMALLIVSIILSASLPVISSRQKAMAQNFNRYQSFPIGGIIVWYHETLPDSTWLECNGQSIPTGIEYEQARKVFGNNVPNFQGMFLRGYGSQSHTKNNGSTIGDTATIHASGALGVIQGDAVRNVTGGVNYLHNVLDDFVNSYNTHANGIFAASGITRSNASITSGSSFDYFFNLSFNLSRSTPTSNEIRPVNIAVKYIAKVRY